MVRPRAGQGSTDVDHESDRRIAVRHIACFPAHIDGGEEMRLRTAVIRDLSATGTLLLTRAILNVGDRVKLNLYLTQDLSAPCLREGRVVRFEKRPPSVAGVWPHSVAVAFDDPLDGFDEVITEVAARQKRLGFLREDE